MFRSLPFRLRRSDRDSLPTCRCTGRYPVPTTLPTARCPRTGRCRAAAPARPRRPACRPGSRRRHRPPATVPLLPWTYAGSRVCPPCSIRRARTPSPTANAGGRAGSLRTWRCRYFPCAHKLGKFRVDVPGRTRFRIVAKIPGLRLQLLRAQRAALDEPALERRRQPPVVARQVHLGVEALQSVAGEGPLDREHEPEHPALPLVVEDRRVPLGLHGPVARHSAHVVYATRCDRSAPALVSSYLRAAGPVLAGHPILTRRRLDPDLPGAPSSTS